MSKKMYRVITEWDMGMELNVYKSREDAWKDLKRAHYSLNIEGEFPFENYVEGGFYSVYEVEVVEFEKEVTMTEKMYRVGVEWPMGMELNVYKSREDAWRDLKGVHNSMTTQGKLSPDLDFEYCREAGFYSVEELELVENE